MGRHDRSGSAKELNTADVLLLVAIVVLPWFFGGVDLDAYRAAAGLVALAAGWVLARRGFAGLGLGRRALWLLPAFLLGAFAFAQVVPLPRAWVATLSPKAASIQGRAFGPEGQGTARWLAHIEDDARARVPEAAAAPPDRGGALGLDVDAPSPPEEFTLSLHPDATLERACWYTTLLLAFLLVSSRTASSVRAGAYRATLFVLFGALATVGVLNHVTAPGVILWMQRAPEGTRPFGPYVNPSHFAGAMELGVPWLLGYGLHASTRRSDENRKWNRTLPAMGAAVLGAGAALLAASKMGAVTIGVASIVLIAFAFRHGRRRWLVIAGTLVAATALGAIALYGPLRGRISDFESVQGGLFPTTRGMAWTASWGMARDYALTGSGFGAFSEIIPAYLPRGDSESWLQLHNDYLEVGLAGGLIGAVLVAWLAVAYAVRLARVVGSAFAHDRGLPALGLALGLLGLAAHEAVDFNLQVPANALLFVVIAAIGVAPLAGSAEGA